MKNPNTKANRLQSALKARWSEEDYPGGEPRFQILLFAKDIGIFLLLPVFSIVVFKSLETAATGPKRLSRSTQTSNPMQQDGIRTQIIEFASPHSSSTAKAIATRAPGSLVKVRLLNVIETYSGAPVHAQIVDLGLGRSLLGGTLIGDATADPTFERINITFRFARDPLHGNSAIPIAARALNLNGTLGIVARKKEGFFSRAAIGSSGIGLEGLQGKNETQDLKQIVLKALTSGLIQEFNAGNEVEKSRAHVLSLQPRTEFFAELTDFFPGARK